MKWLLGAGVLVGLLALAIVWRESPREMERRAPDTPAATIEARLVKGAESEPKIAATAVRPTALTAAEKAARVEKIRADYDAIRKGVADELAAVSAASAAGPGPFGETRVFLRRLVLLQREERNDLAQVLDARELEDFELRESPAGQLVAARLGATAATEEQRRAVFRIEREFDERFGFVFDLAKEALAERQELRKETDARIRVVLGEELFRTWMEAALR